MIRKMSVLQRLMLLKMASGGGSLTEYEATGNPAAFNTNVAKPLKQLLIPFSPVQDLHGQNAPYPAGGGANLLDLNKATFASSAYGMTISHTGDVITVSGTATATGNPSFNVISNYSDSSLSGKGYVVQAFNVTGNKSIGNIYGFRTENEKAVAIRIDNVTAGDNVNISFKISVASTSQSEFHPYSNICPITGWTGVDVTANGTTIPVTFPAEAGTVYGGTLDLTTGVLTVDFAKYVSNGSISNEWSVSDQGTTIRPVLSGANLPDGAPKPSSTDTLKTNYLVPSTSTPPWSAFIGSTGNFLCFLPKDQIADKTAWLEYLAEHPLEICYELDEPYEFQLTPQQLSTIIGDNVIYTSTNGQNTVKYLKRG